MVLSAPFEARVANFYFYFSLLDRQELSSSSRSVNAVRKDWILQNIFQRNLEGNFYQIYVGLKDIEYIFSFTKFDKYGISI